MLFLAHLLNRGVVLQLGVTQLSVPSLEDHGHLLSLTQGGWEG